MSDTIETTEVISETPAPAPDARPEPLLEGMTTSARILGFDDEELLASLPAWNLGARMPAAEWPHEELPVPGDEIDVFIDRIKRDPHGEVADVLISKDKADKLALWQRLSDAEGSDTRITGTVVATVRGGLSVDIGVRGFLPSSQIELRPVADPSAYVGRELELCVVKFNKSRGNAVLTRRPLLEMERVALREQTLKDLHEGEVLSGVVSSIASYGAFVDIGGVDGLLHVTDMSWGRVSDPHQMFAVGDEIQVKVLKIDRDKGKISLGHKQLGEDPWTHADQRYAVGATLTGRVVSLTDYGAFIELEPGIEGLVHVSEMSWSQRVKDPRALVNVGDEVKAVVLDVDLKQKRVALGMKQTTENPWKSFADKHPKDSRVTGTVSSITEFGAFLTVDDLDGLIHASDISWTDNRIRPADYFKKGDTVEAVVLAINVPEQRLSLGIKQLTVDPWAELAKRHPRGSSVTGKVTRTTDFGAFIAIEEGIEGLCHISELSEDRVERVEDVVQAGAEVDVTILDIDRKKRKISLSLKTGAGGDFREYMQEETPLNPFGAALSRANLGPAQAPVPSDTGAEETEDKSGS